MKTIQFSSGRSVRTIFPLFLFIFCFAFTSQATIYYISPTGNDATGNGTAGNPWKTLFKACSVVSTPGDIIHVNAGVYTETATSILKEGISIEGVDSTSSIIKSTITTDYIPIIKANSVAEGTNGNQHISNLKFDGQNLATAWAIIISGRKNFSIHDCSFVDFRNRGVIFTGRVDNASIEPTTYASGNTFYNNIMNNCAEYAGSGFGCLCIGGQDGMLIHDNTISQTSRPEGQNGWPIKYHNEGYLKGCKIYNNVLNHIPQGNWLGISGWDFNIELFNESGLEIYGNTMTGSGIDCNYQTKGNYPYSVWIHDNIIKMTTLNTYSQFGITLEFGTENAIIENNTIDKHTSGIVFVPRNGNTVKNITIRKNLMSNIGISANNGSMIFFGGEGNTNYFDSINVYNNTMVGDAVIKNYFGIELPKPSAGYVKNINIKNNIITNTLSSCIVQANVPVVINNLGVTYNDFYNTGNNNNPLWNGSIPTNYTYSNTLHSNPMFVAPADFHLQAASPAVDAGIFVGLAYAGIAPDGGYAEAGAIILPVTLINFGVTENQGKNLLQWTTASESNSDYISIERSSDGRNFTTIGTVKAAGFSSTDIHYTFTDATPLTGLNYYRLALVDKDNSKGYSNTAAVSNKSNTSLTIATAQLSRSNNNVAITVVSAQNQKTSLTLFDANGKLFLNEPVQLQKGMNTINKNTSTLSSGIYYIKLSAADETVVKNVLSKE
jgi:hypothetical protein